MKNRIALALLAAFGATASLCAAEDFAIEWGEPFSLGAGGYARIHRLSDGRYMLAYGRGADMAARYSRKGAPEKWSKPQTVARHFVATNAAESEAAGTDPAGPLKNGLSRHPLAFSGGSGGVCPPPLHETAFGNC